MCRMIPRLTLRVLMAVIAIVAVLSARVAQHRAYCMAQADVCDNLKSFPFPLMCFRAPPFPVRRMQYQRLQYLWYASRPWLTPPPPVISDSHLRAYPHLGRDGRWVAARLPQ